MACHEGQLSAVVQSHIFIILTSMSYDHSLVGKKSNYVVRLFDAYGDLKKFDNILSDRRNRLREG